MSVKLEELTLEGFKTIRRLEAFRPGPLTVMIGGNGAGKSNLISFFRLLQWMLAPPGQLQLHVATHGGGASALLHDGPAVTREIAAHLKLRTETGLNEYAFLLSYAAGDTLRFAEEKYRYSSSSRGGVADWKTLEPGLAEAGLNARAEAGDVTARTINTLVRRCVVYQFHNTSSTARIKQRWNREDGRHLKEDAGNLAPFLYRLRDEHPECYRRIVATIRQVMPFFADFALDPTGEGLLLQWRELGSDMVFGGHQGADGMLRFLALTALLLQPEEDLPDVVILDEPELGLHPHACELIASLLRSTARTRQVIVSTQSTMLVDHFAPEDIVVVDRPERTSEYRRLKADDLEDWLKEFEGGRAYALSELWEKNVLGGGPAR